MKIMLFKADWCAQCRKQMEEYRTNTPPVKVETYDVGDYRELKSLLKYLDVGDVPTTVLAEDDFNAKDESTWSRSKVLYKKKDFITTEKITKRIERCTHS